jgi:RNA-directed DNA polymerase
MKENFTLQQKGAQGGIISPMLCNAVLNGIEPLIRTRFPLKPVEGIRYKTYISRYADDIVVTGRFAPAASQP